MPEPFGKRRPILSATFPIMKRFLALLMIFLVAALAQARAGDQDFTLVNKTGFDIHSVFVSPHSTDEWEEDVLGRDVLANGDHVDIKFSRATKGKAWDLKVADKNGKEFTWESINLLEVSKVTIEFKDGKASATYE